MLRIIILVVALGAGGLAAWVALTMQPRTSESAPVVVQAPPPPMVEVLVAAGDLPQGRPLDEKSLKWQSWPEAAMAPGYISRVKQPEAHASLVGSVVRNPMVAGEPVREDKLVRGVGLLASLLPSGKRAVAIRISPESTAGGFVLPNDRVDVIQTITQPGQGAGGSTEIISRLILSNIRVMAIDQTVQDPKNGSVAIGKTATLELNPEQVEVISSAQATGALSLALRSIADSEQIGGVRHLEAVASVVILRGGRSEVVRLK